MDPAKYISISEFCSHHQIDFSFVHALQEYGLVEIISIEETPFIELEQVRDLEKILRLHYELDINLEGIDAIYHLLNRISDLQDEVRVLRNKLNRYEL